MTDRIAEIAARCEAWKKQEAWHLECGLCNGNELAVKDIPYLLGQLAERDKELKRLQKEVASLAIESIEREKTLAKLEAEVMTAMETERRPEIKEAPDDSRHERKIYDLRRV